jgi:hypothetical protein
MLPLLKQVNLAGLVLLSPALAIGPQGDSELVEALPAMAVAAAAHGKGALAGLPPAQVEARAAAFAAGLMPAPCWPAAPWPRQSRPAWRRRWRG